MNLEAEQRELMAKLANVAPTAPAINTPTESSVATAADVAKAETTPLPNPAPEPKVESAIETKKETPVKAEVNLDAVVDSWDTDQPTVKVEAPTAKVDVPFFDFSEVAKVLDKEVKTKDDLLSTLKEYKTKVDSVAAERATIPQDLLKAIEIAKQNGNYLEYLGVSRTDWSKQDPIEVYENYVVDRMADPNTGQIDFEKVEAFLDRIDDVDKEIRGKELISQYSSYQANAKLAIEREAQEMQQRQDAALKSALSSIEDVGGFKVSQAHKDELYAWYSSGQMWKDLFHDQNGNLDFKKVLTNGFITKYWNKIDNFRKQQIRNAAKREILEELQQPAINASTDTVQVESTKPYGLDDYLKELKKQKGF